MQMQLTHLKVAIKLKLFVLKRKLTTTTQIS
jgi:hypothetical protein